MYFPNSDLDCLRISENIYLAPSTRRIRFSTCVYEIKVVLYQRPLDYAAGYYRLKCRIESYPIVCDKAVSKGCKLITLVGQCVTGVWNCHFPNGLELQLNNANSGRAEFFSETCMGTS